MSEVAEKKEDQLEIDNNQTADNSVDNAMQIEIIDDTPLDDKDRPKRTEGSEPKIPDDDEIKTHGDSAQKRIKQLKYEYHEERRAKDEATRLSEEAIKYAETIKRENEKLKRTLNDGENVLFEQATGRANAEVEAAKKEYKEAYETGDPDKITEAQQKLNLAQIEQSKIKDYKPVPKPKEQVGQPQYRPAQPQQQPQQQVQQAPLNKYEKNWLDTNKDWFQKDNEMTGYAYGVHQNLVMGGIDPRIEPEKYYLQLSENMRKRFPDKFEDEKSTTSQTGIVVTPTNRSASKSRKVQLTKTALNLAKRLGLTAEQYAAQVLKEKEKTNG